MRMDRQRSADVLVIGAGVAGLSTALHLAERGQRVVVFDRGELGSGATGRASGLLGQLRGSAAATRMLVESLEILRELERETSRSVFTQSGSLRIAATPERAGEVERALRNARAAGLPAEAVDPSALRRLIPYAETGDVIAACFCPTDGYVHPPEVAELYVEAGRRRGVEYRPHTPVEEVRVDRGRVTGCRAGGEDWHAPVVVNAAGPWAHLVAGMGREALPTAGIGHCYLTAFPDPPLDPATPSLRDRGALIYSRPTREGALHVGIYETRPVTYAMEALPPAFRMAELETRWEHPTVQLLLTAARHRFPLLRGPVRMRLTTGIMAWSPDGGSLCGPLPGALRALPGFFHCAGFCGHGVMQSAGIGRLMAELILDGTCRYDLAELAADRFADRPELAEREQVELYCAAAYAACYARVEGEPPGPARRG